MTLSHPLKFLLTGLSRLLILLDMAPTSDYRKAYKSAKDELAELMQRQLETEKRIVVVRKSLEQLAALCEDEGIEIETSVEAAYLLENTNLADEIRHILVGAWPGYLKPHKVKANLEQLGWDLRQYRNPQATIHMVMKRMAESGSVQEETSPEDGKKMYRAIPMIPPTSRIAEAFAQAKGGRFNSERFNKGSR
jgi:hypothetical protein